MFLFFLNSENRLLPVASFSKQKKREPNGGNEINGIEKIDDRNTILLVTLFSDSQPLMNEHFLHLCQQN